MKDDLFAIGGHFKMIKIWQNTAAASQSYNTLNLEMRWHVLAA